MRILVVEDEELYADQIEMLLDKMGHEVIDVCAGSRKALDILKSKKIDLILMDIHIKGEYDGIELADLVNREHEVPIIFISSIKDDLTFNRVKRVNARNFILKPFDQLQLQRAIELAIITPSIEEDHGDSINEHHIYVKNRNKIEKVELKDVCFLKSEGHHTNIYTNVKRFLIRRPIIDVAEELSSSKFIQTHRSYMINIEKIDSIDLAESTIYMGEYSIPISKRNRSSVIKALGAILE